MNHPLQFGVSVLAWLIAVAWLWKLIGAARGLPRIPNLLQNLLGEGVLSASFIPVYARKLAEGDEEEAGRLAGAILAGGLIGPLLLMFGLANTDAATASLLLTLEGAATVLIAWFVFMEAFDRRIAIGMGLLVAGALTLSWSGTPSLASLTGPAAIVGACVAWGLDNNLTRKISLADPLQIVQWKGLVAGPINLSLGLWASGSLPGIGPGLLAALIGFLGYGVSLALFVLALRQVGAARTGAYFSTAPFLGAVLSLVLLREAWSWSLLGAGLLMAFGVWLHLTEERPEEASR